VNVVAGALEIVETVRVEGRDGAYIDTGKEWRKKQIQS